MTTLQLKLFCQKKQQYKYYIYTAKTSNKFNLNFKNTIDNSIVTQFDNPVTSTDDLRVAILESLNIVGILIEKPSISTSDVLAILQSANIRSFEVTNIDVDLQKLFLANSVELKNLSTKIKDKVFLKNISLAQKILFKYDDDIFINVLKSQILLSLVKGDCTFNPSAKLIGETEVDNCISRYKKLYNKFNLPGSATVCFNPEDVFIFRKLHNRIKVPSAAIFCFNPEDVFIFTKLNEKINNFISVLFNISTLSSTVTDEHTFTESHASFTYSVNAMLKDRDNKNLSELDNINLEDLYYIIK